MVKCRKNLNKILGTALLTKVNKVYNHVPKKYNTNSIFIISLIAWQARRLGVVAVSSGYAAHCRVLTQKPQPLAGCQRQQKKHPDWLFSQRAEKIIPKNKGILFRLMVKFTTLQVEIYATRVSNHEYKKHHANSYIHTLTLSSF